MNASQSSDPGCRPLTADCVPPPQRQHGPIRIIKPFRHDVRNAIDPGTHMAASGWLAVRAFDGVCPGSELAGLCVVELEGSTPTCEPTPLSANRSKPDAPAHARVRAFAGDPRPRRNPDSK
jgi:hypothetical protein